MIMLAIADLLLLRLWLLGSSMGGREIHILLDMGMLLQAKDTQT